MRTFGAGRVIVPGVTVTRHLNRSNALDVYEAWDARRACAVVVKTVRPDRLRDARTRADLLTEGERLVRLCHPGIVRGYEVVDGARPAIVLETVTGETLGHLFDRLDRRLSAVEVAHLGLHLAGALHYLHGEGLLHLDLKPSNAVAEAGRAKLLDLSVAGPPGPHAAARGTWANMAPEQARGGEVTAAADVFGLGTILYEAAAGEPPFEHFDDDLPTLHRRPDPLRTHRRIAFGDLVDACLAWSAADRPTLAEVRDRLTAAAAPRP